MARRRASRKPKTRADLHKHALKRISRAETVSYEDLNALYEKISSGYGRLEVRQSHNRSVWSVDWNGETVYVVLDRRRKAIVTLLTEEMVGTMK